MVLKLSKKVDALQFCADLSKKLKSNKASYKYTSKSSHYIVLENDKVYRDLRHCSWDISNWNIKRMLTQQKFSRILWL